MVTGALEVERREKRMGAALEAAPMVHVADADLLAAFEAWTPPRCSAPARRPWSRAKAGGLQAGRGPRASRSSRSRARGAASAPAPGGSCRRSARTPATSDLSLRDAEAVALGRGPRMTQAAESTQPCRQDRWRVPARHTWPPSIFVLDQSAVDRFRHPPGRAGPGGALAAAFNLTIVPNRRASASACCRADSTMFGPLGHAVVTVAGRWRPGIAVWACSRTPAAGRRWAWSIGGAVGNADRPRPLRRGGGFHRRARRLGAHSLDVQHRRQRASPIGVIAPAARQPDRKEPTTARPPPASVGSCADLPFAVFA